MCVFCSSEGSPDALKAALYIDAYAGLDLSVFCTAALDLTQAYAIPSDTTTTATISIGETIEETLEEVSDSDWFRIDLVSGQTIKVDLQGFDHEGSTLGAVPDTFLRIYDASGTFITGNDDIDLGVTLDSQIIFTVPATGSYFIEADSWRSETSVFYNGYTGDYRLSVALDGPAEPATPVEAIRGEYSLNTGNTILVYFANAGNIYATGQANYVAEDMNAYERAQFESIFEQIETFTNLQFSFTSDPAFRTVADLEIATSKIEPVDGVTLLGFFYLPSASGEGSFGVLNTNDAELPYWTGAPGGTFDTGGFMYSIALHEIGHALGLGHPHDFGAETQILHGVGDPDSRGQFDLNSAVYTVMSYNEGWGAHPAGLAGDQAVTGHSASYGALDVAALQALYGSNVQHATGDDVYDLQDDTTAGSGAGYYTTWDAGGNDTFRYTGNDDAVIDLRPATLAYEDGGGGHVSHVKTAVAGRTIANGVVIENALSGGGADLLIGNDVANRLTGGQGDDTLTGGGGADIIDFAFGDGSDVVTDFDVTEDQIDLSGLQIGYANLAFDDTSEGLEITYALGVTSRIVLNGVTAAQFSSANVIADGGDGTEAPPVIGTGNADNLVGSSMGEAVQGFEGADQMFGRGGDDMLYGGDATDVIAAGIGRDFVDAGMGNDEVLGQGDDDSLDGGGGNDTLRGGSGHDSLMGQDGRDTLYGQGNNDHMSGGDGDDLLIAAAGLDVLDGGAGNDNLRGGDGADRLSGGVGNDFLVGGAHSDVFVFMSGWEFDTIGGFEDNLDLIEIEASLAGGRTAAEIISELAVQVGASTLIDFGGGNQLKINNVLPHLLVNDIELI